MIKNDIENKIFSYKLVGNCLSKSILSEWSDKNLATIYCSITVLYIYIYIYIYIYTVLIFIYGNSLSLTSIGRFDKIFGKSIALRNELNSD